MSQPSGVISVAATQTTVLDENPYRVKATFVNDSANTIYLVKGYSLTGTGIRLNANGGSYEDIRDMFGYIYRGIYTAYAPAGASNLVYSEESQG